MNEIAHPSAGGGPARAGGLIAYVGCYTAAEREGHGSGISVYEIEPDVEAWRLVQTVSLVNPSLVIADRSGRRLYVAQGDTAFVRAFAIDTRSGRLLELNCLETGGLNSVDLALDPTERFLISANYASGDLTVFTLDDDGSLADLTAKVTLSGTPGPHPKQQTSSHPHGLTFDPTGRFLMVPDKGLDAIHVFEFEAGKLGGAASIETAPGAGPRHLAFHPTQHTAYVVNELDSTITAYAFDAASGSLELIQTVSTLPPDFQGPSIASEVCIHPSGIRLYASNRGSDSIVSFEIAPKGGELGEQSWRHTGGRWPRTIACDPDGARLYAANQHTDTIMAFDASEPGLTPLGEVARTGSPATIQFLRSPKSKQ